MSTKSFGRFRFNPIPDIAGIQFDCNITEDHTVESQIASFPIEDGTLASDHIQLSPRELTLEGVISPYPASIFQAGGRLINLIDTAEIGNPMDKHIRGWESLRALWLSRRLFTCNTSIEKYKNMAVVAFRWTRDVETTNILRVMATLRQFNIVHVTFQTNLSDDVIDQAQGADHANMQGQEPL